MPSSTSKNVGSTGSLGTADRQAAVKYGAEYTTAKRVVFVVNNDRFFLTHRASWASALVASGARVTVIAEDTGHAENIRNLGLDYIPLPFGRESISAKEALRTGVKLFFLLLKLRPHVVFLVATAAYSLGWPAAMLLPKARFIRVITGAGRALTSDASSSRAADVVRSALGLSAKLHNVFSLFQLQSDQANFVDAKLAETRRSFLIAGTGVDTNTWTPSDRSEKCTPIVLFAARLFREKGIYEFIDMARAVPQERARFVVVGRPDAGVSSSVTLAELKSWQDEGIIDYLGESDDMLSTFRETDILVLPTTHPEGTPRTLIEAAACGVVAIASDQEGCRAVVEHGETGLIAKVEDRGSFSAALETLLGSPQYRMELSNKARVHAIEKFSLETTLRQIYEAAGVEH